MSKSTKSNSNREKKHVEFSSLTKPDPGPNIKSFAISPKLSNSGSGSVRKGLNEGSVKASPPPGSSQATLSNSTAVFTRRNLQSAPAMLTNEEETSLSPKADSQAMSKAKAAYNKAASIKPSDISILLVDDETVVLKQVSALLRKVGYKVTTASNGSEALAILKGAPSSFQMILTDVHMPKVSGFQLLEQIRADNSFIGIPIIMMSSIEDLDIVVKCLRFGADDYLLKPVRSAVLKNLWSNVWRKRKEKEFIHVMGEMQDEIGDLKKQVIDAVETPVQAITKTLSDLITAHKLTPEVKETLSSVIRSLSSTTNVYKPALSKVLNNPSVDSRTKAWLRTELDTNELGAVNMSQPKGSAEGESNEPPSEWPIGIHHPSVGRKMLTDKSAPPPLVHAGTVSNLSSPRKTAKGDVGAGTGGGSISKAGMMGSIFKRRSSAPNLKVDESPPLMTPDFDVWRYTEEELLLLLEDMFEFLDILKHYSIPKSTFQKFLLAVRSKYSSENPYHNFRHAFDVTQTLFTFLTTYGASQHLTYLEIFGAMIAALCHDMEHPGLTNSFHMATGSKLALRYNDKSVLEMHHASALFFLTANEETNIFSTLSRDQFKRIRGVIIAAILATDLSRHVELLTRWNQRSASFSRNDPDDRALFVEIIVKCCDISNAVKKFQISKIWTELIQEEFWNQGDKERDLNLQISPFMDRHDEDATSQMVLNFIDFLVSPLYSAITPMLPEASSCIAVMNANRQRYQNLKDEAKSVMSSSQASSTPSRMAKSAPAATGSSSPISRK